MDDVLKTRDIKYLNVHVQTQLLFLHRQWRTRRECGRPPCLKIFSVNSFYRASISCSKILN